MTALLKFNFDAYGMEWLEDGGTCTQVGPDMWFSDNEAHRNKAKALCGDCPLIEACAEWSLHNETKGVWGGMTEADRDRTRKERGISVLLERNRRYRLEFE